MAIETSPEYFSLSEDARLLEEAKVVKEKPGVKVDFGQIEFRGGEGKNVESGETVGKSREKGCFDG